VLSLRATYGDNFGKLLLDGAPLDSDIFKSKCFLVGQYDKNWPHLTVQETCTFAARLFGIVKKEIDITNIVHEVGLTDVLHSRNSSLSGGQQRRLSLAIALLKQPAVLFLDEVTSGLDSASADRVCKALRRIVDEKNIMVICTIHQPSTKIFLECFDQLILLSKGRVAYAGGTRRAEDYFSCLGYPVPAMTNPSEHYLELVNSDFGDVETVDKIIDAWEQETSDAGADIDVEHQSQSNTGTIFSPDLKLAKQSLFQETQIVLRRHFIMICRDVSCLVLSSATYVFNTSKQIFAHPPLTWIVACALPWSLYYCPCHELYFCVCVLEC
jgi:ABC-type multidrug transport system ATPase subunit